jgi:hypothetical protein
MSNKLRKKMEIPIMEPSKTVFTLADGKKAASLGKSELEIEVEEIRIPVIVQIIDSSEDDLILGTELFAKNKGNIDFHTKLLTLRVDGNIIEIPIYFTKRKNHESSENELSEEEIEEEYESEFSEEEIEDEYEQYESEDEEEIFYSNASKQWNEQDEREESKRRDLAEETAESH